MLRYVEPSYFFRNVKQYAPDKFGRSFALILSKEKKKELPFLCTSPFILHTPFGIIEASIELLPGIRQLREDLIEPIVRFQTEIIPLILQARISFAKVDSESSEYLIAPVNKSGEVDEECLRSMMSTPQKPDLFTVVKMNF